MIENDYYNKKELGLVTRGNIDKFSKLDPWYKNLSTNKIFLWFNFTNWNFSQRIKIKRIFLIIIFNYNKFVKDVIQLIDFHNSFSEGWDLELSRELLTKRKLHSHTLQCCERGLPTLALVSHWQVVRMLSLHFKKMKMILVEWRTWRVLYASQQCEHLADAYFTEV